MSVAFDYKRLRCFWSLQEPSSSSPSRNFKDKRLRPLKTGFNFRKIRRKRNTANVVLKVRFCQKVQMFLSEIQTDKHFPSLRLKIWILVIFKAALTSQRQPSCPYKPLSFQTLRNPQFSKEFSVTKIQIFSFRGEKCSSVLWKKHQYLLTKLWSGIQNYSGKIDIHPENGVSKLPRSKWTGQSKFQRWFFAMDLKGRRRSPKEPNSGRKIQKEEWRIVRAISGKKLFEIQL